MDALTDNARTILDLEAPAFAPHTCGSSDEVAALHRALEVAHDERRRAECMAAIQNDAVQLALEMEMTHPTLTWMLSLAFFVASLVFAYRSFYSMRIESQGDAAAQQAAPRAA